MTLCPFSPAWKEIGKVKELASIISTVFLMTWSFDVFINLVAVELVMTNILFIDPKQSTFGYQRSQIGPKDIGCYYRSTSSISLVSVLLICTSYPLQFSDSTNKKGSKISENPSPSTNEFRGERYIYAIKNFHPFWWSTLYTR